MGRPLLVRRGSDLMSMWLGGSEKNVAEAFREAEAENAVLLIEEVDSFLQDRRGAQRSWEVTLVNEMLTQMESFEGLFIASTNLMTAGPGGRTVGLRRLQHLHANRPRPPRAERATDPTNLRTCNWCLRQAGHSDKLLDKSVSKCNTASLGMERCK